VPGAQKDRLPAHAALACPDALEVYIRPLLRGIVPGLSGLSGHGV